MSDVVTWRAQPCQSDRFYLGEGCRWDEVRDELYWVNLERGEFFRATADGGRLDVVARYDLGGSVSAVAPMEDRDEGWIVARDQSIFSLSVEGALTELAAPEAKSHGEIRTNDGAADPWGSFWVGSMAYDNGVGRASLYRFDSSTGLATILSGVTISNGLGWSGDARRLYYVDSGPGTVDVFDVDDAGDVTNRRPFLRFDVDQDGAPDGLCLDAEDHLWICCFNGGVVRRYSPDGELRGVVTLPTSQPTCCSIGGANGTTLYVTTAQEDMSPEQLEREPEAGRLFFVDVGVHGVPLHPYRATRQETLARVS